MSTSHPRTFVIAVVAAAGAAVLLVMSPLLAGLAAGHPPVEMVDTSPGGDFGYGAAVRTALITSALTAAAFLATIFRARRRAVGVPPEPDPDPPARAAPAPLPDDVLAAIPPRVTAVTHFGAHGGFVDAGGLLVWAALIRPGEPVHPGRELTVLSPSHERDALLVTPAVPTEAEQAPEPVEERVHSG